MDPCLPVPPAGPVEAVAALFIFMWEGSEGRGTAPPWDEAGTGAGTRTEWLMLGSGLATVSFLAQALLESDWRAGRPAPGRGGASEAAPTGGDRGSLLLCPESMPDRSPDNGPADWLLTRAPESCPGSRRRSCLSRPAHGLASSPGPGPEASCCLLAPCCPSWASLGGHCCAGLAGAGPQPSQARGSPTLLPKPTLSEPMVG